MSQNINLYDSSLRKRRDLLDFGSAVAMAGAAIVCVALATAMARWSLARIEPVAAAGAAELQAQQAAAQALAGRVASSKPDGALQAEVAKVQRTLLQRRSALEALDAGAINREGGFASRLEAFARQSLEGLWLTGVLLHQDDVRLKGRALNPALIPVYVQRLDREPSLQGRAFKALDVVRPFDASAKAAPAPAPGDAVTSPPLRAAYVEFSLAGSGGADPGAAVAEVRR